MKLLKTFCGAVFVMLLLAAINATATPPGTNSWSSSANNNGEFNADLYCVPTFTVTGTGGISNGDHEYTQLLGNYFVGYVGTVSNLSIVFTLEGPGEYYNNTPIDYSVRILHQHTTTDHGAKIQAQWEVSSANVTGTPSAGWEFPYPYIHLNQDPSNNCKSKATFTITSLNIDLLTNWVAGTALPTTETFSFVLEASANI
jgi:hypothetical protein